MSYQEELSVHTLFGALTRPAMMAGVTFEYHLLNLMVSVCVFIMMSNLLYGFIFLPIHLFGWMVCREEPSYFKLAYVRWLGLPQIPNASLWGVRCYEPY